MRSAPIPTLSLAALVLLVFSWTSAHGQPRPKDLQEVPEPPPIPEPVESGEALEPEVTIRPGEKEVVQEYRLNGRLYAIKVTPKKGPEYFLVDTDGDGNLETRRYALGPQFVIPGWVILRW